MNSMTAPALRVESLSVSFGSLHALREVSWECSGGEILGLIGPNGAGKSTCLEAATNMVNRRGRVFLNGADITALPTWELAPRGLRRAFQQNAFFGELSVLENMTGMLIRSQGTSLFSSVCTPWVEAARRRASEQRAVEILERFSISRQYHDIHPGKIPYGVQRLLSVALAYADGAQILLLDEPAAGLGGEDIEQLATLLRDLRQEGLALVLIEHHMDLVMAVADRIVVLNQGSVLFTGRPDEVRSDARVVDAYLGGVQ